MKKLLISILTILLIILNYIVITKGILNVKSLKSVKDASNKLESDFDYAKELSNKTYPSEVKGLEDAIEKLKISKQDYESKNIYNTEEDTLGSIETKTYRIHYLWTILGNYKKDRGIQSLNLDLITTEIQDNYDLEFTLVGPYTNIIDFLYDIENDEKLNFQIQKLGMSQYSTTTTISVNDSENPENSRTETEKPFNSITNISSSSVSGAQNSNNNSTNNENKNNAQNTTDENKQNTNIQNSNGNNSRSETIYNPKWVKTTFTVENIGITLD